MELTVQVILEGPLLHGFSCLDISSRNISLPGNHLLSHIIKHKSLPRLHETKAIVKREIGPWKTGGIQNILAEREAIKL